jgi:hypothetical protein
MGLMARRQSEAPWRLVRDAIGGRKQLSEKTRRMGRTVKLWFDRDEIESRLSELEKRGMTPRRPSRWQLLFGGLDMMRWVIVPASKDYYVQRGISFGFHTLLRFLDDPVSIIDPTGFLSERDTIIGHVLQVVHLNPVYDLQLLSMFPDGLEQLEQQTAAMVDGTHTRAASIGAIVEDPGYHARLLAYVRAWRADPTTPDMVRQEQTLRDDPSFAAAERQFATLPGFLEYCLTLPERPLALVRRYRRTRKFPVA